jgi:hypothetical protein
MGTNQETRAGAALCALFVQYGIACHTDLEEAESFYRLNTAMGWLSCNAFRCYQSLGKGLDPFCPDKPAKPPVSAPEDLVSDRLSTAPQQLWEYLTSPVGVDEDVFDWQVWFHRHLATRFDHWRTVRRQAYFSGACSA